MPRGPTAYRRPWDRAKSALQRQFRNTIRSAFLDFHLEIEDQIAEGDKVVTRLTASGKYRGGLEDISFSPAIGKHVQVSEILIHRISAGKVVEGWIEFDQLSLRRQLGLIQSKGEGKQ